ncbi:hypothetical protein LSH36_1456g00002 [Paralvinella palmiformis]|uniref:Sulfotransferase domain-containing protein n=1 Tax=Paralvinella palmiformis TaxID=53620 RepID=A0AAD9ITV4_9ANNE|nr:hypothetical protein LSH36_1456g00002 [Paralvinella palmiformis]
MQKIIDKRRRHNSENLGWRMRCFPYFFLIGFTKCGTTDLFTALSYIPDVIRPLTKEPRFWQKFRFTEHIKKDGGSLPRPTLSDYLDTFDEAAEQIRQYTIKTEDGFVYHPGVVGDLDPKTIWCYPNWISIKANKNTYEPRVLSHYQFFAHKKKFTVQPDEFHHSVERFILGLQTCFKKKSIRSCVYQGLVYSKEATTNLKRSIIGSLYYVFIKEWLRVFPKEQFLFMKSEDYFNNRTAAVVEILDFLKLNKSIPDVALIRIQNLNIVNPSAKVGFLEITRTLLQNFLQPFNEKLVTLLRNDQWVWH